MRRYETIFIVNPTAGDDITTGILDKVSSIIDGDGGTLINVDKWGLKKLAYLINKLSQGYYVYIDYAAIPATVAEIERIFKIDENLMKFMTVKLADACDPQAILAEIEAASLEAENAATEADNAESDTTAKEEAVVEKEATVEKKATVEEEAPAEEAVAE